MFSFGERLGMFFPVEGGCLSSVAVSLILLIAVFKWLKRSIFSFGRGNRRGPDATDNSIFLNLMLADLVQALGNLPTIKWMVDGAITEGRLCTAQAVVKQVGIVGVAMTSLAIAVHTFCVLVLRWGAPKYISKLVVLMIWIFTALVIGIPNIIHMKQQYYGNTGYWCWIKSDFKTEQIVTEYLWVWMAALLMAILYTIMFIVMRGWFIIDNSAHGYENGQRQPTEMETEEEQESNAIANLMLFYPAVYIICIFPNSLSRWLFFSGFKVPYQFGLFANTLFSLSGMFNAILFFFTRPDLVVGPSKSPPTQASTEPQFQSHHRDETELTSYSSQKFGSLPTRSLGTSDYVPPDLEKDHSGSLRTHNSRMLLEKGGLRGSPFVQDSDSASHVPSNISGERSYGDFKSMTSAPETYGYLPS